MANLLSPRIEIHVLHKPRGGKGFWKEVENAEQLRMTPTIGKLLKLEIRSFNFMFDAKKTQQNTTVTLYSDKQVINNGFKIVNWKILEYVIEIELKLHKTGSSLQFEVAIKIEDETIVSQRTKNIISKSSSPKPQNEKTKEEKWISDFILANFGVNEDSVEMINSNLEVQGNIFAYRYAQLSDLRLKTNIEDITEALAITSSLQGKRYQWKSGSNISDESRGSKVIGLIAQEVLEVAPEIVHIDSETGILSVNYSEITPLLIEAFKEYLFEYQQQQEDLRNILDSLRERVDAIYDPQIEDSQNSNYVYPISGHNFQRSRYQRCCINTFPFIAGLLLACLFISILYLFIGSKTNNNAVTKIAVGFANLFIILVPVSLCYSIWMCAQRDDIEIKQEEETLYRV